MKTRSAAEITAEQIEYALGVVTQAVARHGDVYQPILDRLTAELGKVRGRGPILPVSLPPRGLSRSQAAAYIGISPSLFDRLVADGRMPPAKRIEGRRVWDRFKLDEAFSALPGDDWWPWQPEEEEVIAL